MTEVHGKKIKFIIIVLVVLLGLNLTALAGVVIYGHFSPSKDTSVVIDNYIEKTNSIVSGEKSAGIFLDSNSSVRWACASNIDLFCMLPAAVLSETIIESDSIGETVISLYKNHAEDSIPFNLTNMFPGDSETKVYRVKISHRGEVTVFFGTEIHSGYETLAEVLKCKVVLQGDSITLYDGYLRDMPEMIEHSLSSADSVTSELAYDITVYMDTSAGNEYMNKELLADFRWWVDEGDGVLEDAPDTGDDFPVVWLGIAVFCLLLCVILIMKRRHNDEQGDLSHEQ